MTPRRSQSRQPPPEPLEHLRDIDRSHEPPSHVPSRPSLGQVLRENVVVRSAGQHNDLRRQRRPPQRFAEPSEAVGVGVNEVVVQHDRSLQLLGDRES